MTSHKTKKQCAIENKTLLAQLPYYNCKVLTSAHPQFNSLIDDNRPSTKLLDSLSSLYDLSVFQLNSLDKHIDPDINLTSNKIRSKYYSPHSFAQFIDSKQLQSKISFLHTNIGSLKKKFEEFQRHVLSEMNFRFTIIGVTETRICDHKCSFNFVPELHQDTVLNQSRHLYVPVVLACSLIKIVNTASLDESPILAIKPYGLNFIRLKIRNLYVLLLIGNTITLMSF